MKVYFILMKIVETDVQYFPVNNISHQLQRKLPGKWLVRGQRILNAHFLALLIKIR